MHRVGITSARWMVFAIAACLLAVGTTALTQSPASTVPRFDVASIRVSARLDLGMSGGVLRGNRYEVRNATMVDLIQTAYNIPAEQVTGGPSWLEWNRYNVVAVASVSTAPNVLREMLKTVLAERFQLKVHDDSTMRAGFALKAAAAKPAFTKAAAEGSCSSSTRPEPNGVLAVNMRCRGASMAALAGQLPRIASQYFPDNQPVVDETGIAGLWDFDLKWTPVGLLKTAGNDAIPITLALERIGLTLEARQVTVAALVVDTVAEQPTPDPTDLATRMPPLPKPVFEVASVRPSAPGSTDVRWGFQAGGQFTASAMPLDRLIRLAWDLPGPEFLIGPKWLDSARFDLVARASAESMTNLPLDSEARGEMLRPLIVERFRIKYHMEERPMTAFRFVADKPKMTRADPTRRTRCVGAFTDSGDRVASQVTAQWTCTNVTLAQFGQLLPRYARDYTFLPVVDATGLQGRWDFALSFTAAAAVRAARTQGAGGSAAIDPTAALTMGEAISRQLGLKLQEEKRRVPVLVIDSVSATPSEN